MLVILLILTSFLGFFEMKLALRVDLLLYFDPLFSELNLFSVRLSLMFT